jgi:RNA polymerase sigma-70 factor (ECF subfamily)
MAEIVRERRLLAAARAGDQRAFELLASPLRPELHLHCYRMLGTLDDADDAVQETLVRAWRAIGRFEPRAPLRTWLFRIATNVSLTILAQRGRRKEEQRLDPLPDRLLDDLSPEALAVERERVELAFVATVQLLPPRQRAVLLMRDVLDWSAREVSEQLGASVASVNSALQRARATLAREREAAVLTKPHSPPPSAVERELVHRFVKAWEATDIKGLVELLADDALLTMPPLPVRVSGGEAIGEFLRTRPAGGRLHRFRLVETGANLRPAVALYLDGEAHALMTLGLAGDRIVALTRFGAPDLLPRFGLPMSYAEVAGYTSETRPRRPLEEGSSEGEHGEVSAGGL